ncbi:hypothetical protein GCM10020219_081480 [Nonomuraea dietziae]
MRPRAHTLAKGRRMGRLGAAKSTPAEHADRGPHLHVEMTTHIASPLLNGVEQRAEGERTVPAQTVHRRRAIHHDAVTRNHGWALP